MSTAKSDDVWNTELMVMSTTKSDDVWNQEFYFQAAQIYRSGRFLI